jgi:hypothetical protein
MTNLSFSGHESFICKQAWLKKVFEFASNHRSFGDDRAVVDLGVGKNMVNSLRFWGKAFDALDEDDKPTELANYLLNDEGVDPYLEDYASLWLLHYHLVKKNRFSIANLVFNEFRKERVEFTKDALLKFLVRKTSEVDSNSSNSKTLEKDAGVFIRMYSKPDRSQKIDIEDDFNGVLIDLGLLDRDKHRSQGGRMAEWFRIESGQREDLPWQIVLYSILDRYPDQESITFQELHVGENSPGAIFALSGEGLFDKIEQMTQELDGIVFSETAGNQVLQFKSPYSRQHILNLYYGNV